MKNRLIDLNDHLFLQLERVNDEDILPDDLKLELKRSAAVSVLASQIVANARLALDAKKAKSGDRSLIIPKMIGSDNDEK